MPTASTHSVPHETSDEKPDNAMPDDNLIDSGRGASSDNKDSNELERARIRLDSALDRLDATLDARAQNRAETAAAMAVEKSEKDAEISRLRAENRALRESQGQVSDRLDSAIGRLQIALGN